MYTCHRHTPFFPLWRARLAPMGQRVARLRQQSLLYLDRLFHPFLPPALLAQADEGPNSRERVFTVRRTFFGFLYQVLNPDCPLWVAEIRSRIEMVDWRGFASKLRRYV